MKTDFEHRLLTYREVEALFGINRSTLASYVFCRRIPFIRLGPRHTRFDRNDLQRWIQSRKVQVVAEPANEQATQ